MTKTVQRNTLAPRRSRHALRRWLKRGAMAALAVAIAGAVIRAWLPSPVAVDVAVAHRIALDVEVAEDGQTRVRDRFVVSAPIGGNLARIQLEAGSRVVTGDVLARIEPPEPALLDARTRAEATARLAGAVARRRRADTMIARATATRDIAVREASRARTLAEQRAIPIVERERTELDEQLAIRDVAAAQTERAAADAEVAAARAVLGDGRSSGSRTVAVTAPVAGRVLRVVRDSAGPVAVGAPLLELGDPQAMEVVVDVLSSDAARIELGMDVALEGWGGERLRGCVRRVEPSAFTRISALGVEEQRVNVIVALDDPPPALGDGFRVDARIVIWHGDGVLAIPASALFRDRERWAVYTIEDRRARLVPVAIGHRGRLDVEIASGLADGATVIIHPGDRVADGARVEPR